MENGNKYIMPAMDIIDLESNDIICTSARLGDPFNDDEGDFWNPKLLG